MSESLRQDMALDYRMVTLVLLHKLSPGVPVTLTEADFAAAAGAFGGEDVALSAMSDGTTLTMALVSRREAENTCRLLDAPAGTPQ